MNSLRSSQSGVALALVVWFVAGMSLLVAGIVSVASVDARMTQVHLARAKAVAAGDGAILLAVLERSVASRASTAGPLIVESEHRMGDVEVTVRLFPANGFIDLNAASREVLAVLFSYAGGLGPKEAQRVADNVVEWRNPEVKGRNSRLVRQRFYALEDVLKVEGVNRQLLDGIRDYTVVGDWASGATDWAASPQAILAVLEQLNPEQAAVMTGRRQNLMRTPAGNRGQTQGVSVSPSSALRADALVAYGGKTWLRRQWLAPGSSVESRLPWKVVRTEPPRVVEG